MTKTPPVKEKAVKHHLREIADCLERPSGFSRG
jgi:hypothetical protein